jgi:hypothetical protein
MHQIFSVWEVLRCIVIEYATLENNTWNSETQGNKYRRALLRLARVKVFSPFALELLWRDASIMQLSSLSFDWQALVQRSGGTPVVSLSYFMSWRLGPDQLYRNLWRQEIIFGSSRS